MKIKAADIKIKDTEWPCQTDWLNRSEEIESLTPLLLKIESPVVMAIDAPWGQGKTTFIRIWRAYLKKNQVESVYFNAWESDFSEDPLVPMLAAIDQWLKEKNPELRNQDSWKTAKRLGAQAAKIGVKAAVRIATLGVLDASDAIEGAAADASGDVVHDICEEFTQQKIGMDQLHTSLQEAVKQAAGSKKNLIFFIDELDRCRPTYAIELLERIKHIFNIEGVIFVLSIDKEQLSESIKSVYGHGFDGEKYLKRFIDFDYPLRKQKIAQYIRNRWYGLEISHISGGGWLGNADATYIINYLSLLCEKHSLSYRDIDQTLSRMKIITLSNTEFYQSHTLQIVILLFLRETNKTLYENLKISSEHLPHAVKFLFGDIKNISDNVQASLLARFSAMFSLQSDSSIDHSKTVLDEINEYINGLGENHPQMEFLKTTVGEYGRVKSRYDHHTAKHCFREVDLVSSLKI